MFMHNHPSGDPTSSEADIQMTKAIIGNATPLGRAVHDHIIVGKNGYASLQVDEADLDIARKPIDGLIGSSRTHDDAPREAAPKVRLLPRVEIRLRGLQVGGFKALAEAIVHRLQ